MINPLITPPPSAPTPPPAARTGRNDLVSIDASYGLGERSWRHGPGQFYVFQRDDHSEVSALHGQQGQEERLDEDMAAPRMWRSRKTSVRWRFPSPRPRCGARVRNISLAYGGMIKDTEF
jgi:pyruvate,water dikinase